MTAKPKIQLYNSQGRPISFSGEVGSGGEGRIFEVHNNPSVVAKVYHEAIDHEKAQKLSLMVNQKTDRLLRLTAWPVDTLHDRPGGNIVGLLMPRVADHKEVHLLYGVKSRLANFPDAGWPFLIHTASNIARAFAVVHEHGHVIGDVNHASILVAQNGTVRLIDCDSFQIAAQGHYYRCLVGVPTHTPPELQDTPFNSVVRTPNHDAFGLAVVIFQMLFMGRHPFSGWYSGGEMSLPRAIKEYRFAYGKRAEFYQMKPPPGTLPLEAVSEPVAKLFEAAFSPNPTRPTATEWVSVLTELSKNLKSCGQNNGHYFLKTLAKCPWCSIEAQAGIILFNIVIANVAGRQGPFNLISVWSQIAAIPAPGRPPTLPDTESLQANPSRKALLYVRLLKLGAVAAVALVVLATATAILSQLNGGAGFWVVVLGVVFACLIIKADNSQFLKGFKEAHQKTQRRYKDLEQRWQTDAGDSRFLAKLHKLESKKAEYQSLPGVKQRKIQQLQAKLRDRQLDKYLDSFRIGRAHISGVGASRKATLQSYGIETAADVTAQAVLGVPGFGPSAASKLIAWKHAIEQKFVFDPAQGMDPADLQDIEREITLTRLGLEKDLMNGPPQLRRIASKVQSARKVLRPQLEDAQRKWAQAAADWTAISSLPKTLTPVFIALWATLVIAIPIKLVFEPNHSETPSYRSSSNQPQAATSSRPPVQPPSGNANQPLVSEKQTQQAQKLFQEGVKNTQAGRYSNAVTNYQRAVALKADYAEAYHGLGYALLKLKQYREASDAFNRALYLNPQDADSYYNLGLSYIGMEHWHDAVGVLTQVTSRGSSNAAVFYNLGVAYEHTRDIKAAITSFQLAVQSKRDYTDAHYELGRLYTDIGNITGATDEAKVLEPLNKQLADQLTQYIKRAN